jgi:hypothetical protein
VPTESQTINKDGLSQDVLAYIEGLEGENATLAEALDVATDELVKASTATDSETDDDADEVIKGLTPEIAEIVKGIVAPLQAENATLTETINGERDIRLTAEQIEKAASFGFGDSTELGPVLKSVMQNCGTDVYDTLVKSLNAASEQIKQAALFTEVGSTAAGTPTTNIGKAASLDAACADLIAKGTATNKTDALRHLARTSPDLFISEGA